MNDIIIALVIGIAAGIIDVVPMIIQKLEKEASVSAFVHWVVLGLIIPFVSWDIAPWLKGLIIGLLSALPIMIIVFPKDKKSLIPIGVMSAVLGVAVGVAGAAFI
jgi:hypothetical protein